ncbi:MAG: hypothetical protein B6I20_03440 [Bacteroidetes bacterium 4572_117]|nr:MAG: hypothetical protein B6I20_03440 [Bacteroidetes bacterium 4572_117]
MPYLKLNKLITLVIVVLLTTVVSCSTKKNTTVTRAYHNLTARFNVYFNGNESLKAGLRKAENNFKDDYSNILPIYKYNDLTISSMLGGETDRTIQKSAKLIKTHSITVKPKVDKKKKTDDKYLEFINKHEYCNWVDDAYFMMGKAHYLKREFITAEIMFLQIINKFKKETIRYDAKLWLAKTKIETEDYEDAQVLLKELKKSSDKPKYLRHEINLVYADMFMKQKNYENAINYLIKSIEKEKKKSFRTRLTFILAQLYNKEENYKKASENFRKVIKLKPSYEMSFSARIKLSEIFEKTESNGAELKKDLLKMAKDDKNIEYLDQIYYALGRIELNEKDIPKAIEYFNKSASAKSSNKNQKVKTYMVLADYYGKKQNYQIASPYYDSIVSSIDESFPDYAEVYPKMASYAGLMKQLNIISTQDSLQKVAKLSESQRNAIIDKLIKKVVDAEKEIANANKTQNSSYDPFMDDINRSNKPKGGNWYFYNPRTVSYGQTDFKKKWGDRKLEDLWRLSNKKMLAQFDDEVSNTSDNQDNSNDADKDKTAKLSNKKREFYLKDLPLSAEKVIESDKKIQNALLKAGIIYADELDEKKKAIDILEVLLKRFSKTETRLDALQLLYNTSNRVPDNIRVDKYKNLIIKDYPDSYNAKILSDPNFLSKQNQINKEVEDIYEKAYSLFKNKKYTATISLCDNAIKKYPKNYLIANFLFVKSLSYGELKNKSKLKEGLGFLVLNYPKTEVSVNAQNILQLIESGKHDEKLYSYEPDSVHYYVIVLAKAKLDFNKLKFNFLGFHVDNFNQLDLKSYQIELDTVRAMLVVQEFKNKENSQLYYKKLLNEKVLETYPTVPYNQFVISYSNYQKYLKDQNTEKYLKFYNENYQN